ncbi:lipoprotein LpqH [Jongsikchunia kroppenstedtii]|uniref:lipoprotein LpqH n=1 Tax=Jongsikchunia kroppenstedtii TaxID=1121721 RepID=UPI00036AB24B|nr:lipoprotein LpqH [Jongsikchunia kroppenstedtii]
MRKIQIIVVGVSAVGLVAALGACSDNKSDNSSSTTTTAMSGMSTSMSMPGSGSVSTGGEASVTVDGKALELTSKEVVCTENGGKTVIAIGNGSGTAGIGATLTSGDNPEVETVGLGATNGVALGWAKGVPGGDAKVTKNAKTYDITGNVPAVDMSNPTAMNKKSFEIKVTCP